MAAVISKLDKGVLSFSTEETTPVTVDASCQVNNVILAQDAPTTEDPLMTLCGDAVGGTSTPGNFHLTGTIVQDFDSEAVGGGVQEFSWVHRNEVVAFTFTPTGATGGITAITGKLTMGFIGIGGDVGVRLQQDFDFVLTEVPSIEPWDTGAMATA